MNCLLIAAYTYNYSNILFIVFTKMLYIPIMIVKNIISSCNKYLFVQDFGIQIVKLIAIRYSYCGFTVENSLMQLATCLAGGSSENLD